MPDAPLGTLLGFDFGTKAIGVAVGQTVTGTANALTTLRASSGQVPWEAITDLVETWSPAGFVVGMPEPYRTEHNPISAAIEKFCRRLEGRYHRPVFTMDETLSTRESEALFYEARSWRSTRFVDVKDALAAQLILQSWLQTHASRSDDRHRHA